MTTPLGSIPPSNEIAMGLLFVVIAVGVLAALSVLAVQA